MGKEIGDAQGATRLPTQQIDHRCHIHTKAANRVGNRVAVVLVLCGPQASLR